MLTNRTIPTCVLPPLAATLASCFLFGGTSRSTTPVQALDTTQAYRQYLAEHPDYENAAQFRERMAELELIEARMALRPVFAPDATFAAQVSGPAAATLGQDTQMIFDSEQDGWVGYQVTQIAPDLQES